MANSVLRRYTPPTCTLEIAASESPLSRWAEQPLLKNLRFQLSFDDPRVPEESRVTVHGDRTHLDALVETVTAYVQHQLVDHMPSPTDSLAIASNGSASFIPFPAQQETAPSENPLRTRGIKLETRGLVSHTLWLGELANEESGEAVKLSTLQLYDLANALEDYSSDVAVLPSLARSSWRMPTISWARTAAMLLLAVGVTATISKFITDVAAPPTQTASAPSAQEKTAPQNFSVETAPSTDLPAPAPTAPATLAPAELPPLTMGQGQTAAGTPSPAARSTTGQPPRDVVQGGQGQSRPEQPSQIRPLPPLAPVTPQVAAAPQQPSTTMIAPSAAGAASTAETMGRMAAPNEAASAPSTAFDVLPQIAEAREILQQRWTPPQGMTQVLEYQLSLNSDGSVERINPLGQQSWLYVRRAGLPNEGAPFVSPFEPGQTPKLRVVLTPDGRVQTFLESLE